MWTDRNLELRFWTRIVKLVKTLNFNLQKTDIHSPRQHENQYVYITLSFSNLKVFFFNKHIAQ